MSTTRQPGASVRTKEARTKRTRPADEDPNPSERGTRKRRKKSTSVGSGEPSRRPTRSRASVPSVVPPRPTVRLPRPGRGGKAALLVAAADVGLLPKAGMEPLEDLQELLQSWTWAASLTLPESMRGAMALLLLGIRGIEGLRWARGSRPWWTSARNLRELPKLALVAANATLDATGAGRAVYSLPEGFHRMHSGVFHLERCVGALARWETAAHAFGPAWLAVQRGACPPVKELLELAPAPGFGQYGRARVAAALVLFAHHTGCPAPTLCEAGFQTFLTLQPKQQALATEFGIGSARRLVEVAKLATRPEFTVRWPTLLIGICEMRQLMTAQGGRKPTEGLVTQLQARGTRLATDTVAGVHRLLSEQERKGCWAVALGRHAAELMAHAAAKGDEPSTERPSRKARGAKRAVARPDE